MIFLTLPLFLHWNHLFSNYHINNEYLHNNITTIISQNQHFYVIFMQNICIIYVMYILLVFYVWSIEII